MAEHGEGDRKGREAVHDDEEDMEPEYYLKMDALDERGSQHERVFSKSPIGYGQKLPGPLARSDALEQLKVERVCPHPESQNIVLDTGLT